MTKYADVAIGELFNAEGGRPKFTKDYLDAHPGSYPVYSASLTKPFGFVDDFQYSGHFLTWVMNGYGGRVQEISGQFSTNRDRGAFIPRSTSATPDLTYLRFAMEPQLVSAAVGRRVDGRLNEYTKLYPDDAKNVVIRLPLTAKGTFDYAQMAELGNKFRRIEIAQQQVRAARSQLMRATFAVDVSAPSKTVSVGDQDLFTLSIGKRVLRTEHITQGIPVFSANALIPFGAIEKTNLKNFDRPSLLWGIDGNFDWNLIPAGEKFATTDHCGRLQVLDDLIDPAYVYSFLQATRQRYGFDRVFRASLQNVTAEVTVTIPIDKRTGKWSQDKQLILAKSLQKLETARAASMVALEQVLKATIPIDA